MLQLSIVKDLNDSGDDVDPRDLLRAIDELPNKLLETLQHWLNVLVIMLYFIGAILVVLGIIEWSTSYNEMEGKRHIIRGFIVILIATFILM